MAISQNGFNYDEQGFLIGIRSFNEKAIDVDHDLKEIIRILNNKNNNVAHDTVDLSDIERKSRRASESIKNYDHTQPKKQSNDSITTQNTGNGANNSQVRSDREQLQQIAMDHQVDQIVSGLNNISEHVKTDPTKEVDQIKSIGNSLKPISHVVERNAVQNVNQDPDITPNTPISNAQKEFNDDEERLLSEISGQARKGLSLKQIVTSVPFIALSLAGAVTLAIKKWWSDKSGSNTSQTENNTVKNNTQESSLKVQQGIVNQSNDKKSTSTDQPTAQQVNNQDSSSDLLSKTPPDPSVDSQQTDQSNNANAEINTVYSNIENKAIQDVTVTPLQENISNDSQSQQNSDITPLNASLSLNIGDINNTLVSPINDYSMIDDSLLQINNVSNAPAQSNSDSMDLSNNIDLPTIDNVAEPLDYYSPDIISIINNSDGIPIAANDRYLVHAVSQDLIK